jgi:ATP-dependent Lhr-like helicase
MSTSQEQVLDTFHPVIAEWFRGRFVAPTDAQRLGWPAIRSGQHTLIAAPTGSGKTLAAFLVCIDRLLGDWDGGRLAQAPTVVYVSPLKALSNDIHRNLELPLAEISAAAAATGDRAPPPIRAVVRTGDTPSGERQAMLRRPPQILVTTPESLYLLITAEKTRELLVGVQTVIVDEIHALARDRRGSHLALTLARLDALCRDNSPTRIGLSATQCPIDDIARFLVGTQNLTADGRACCRIVDLGHARDLDLGLEVPPTDLEAVCSNEQWDEIYQRLVQLVNQHRSTLVFVNTRRLAERVAHRLAEHLGDGAVASHHGSLSRELRHSAERRLKAGTLKAIVATASLEMGIDVGYVDLVCQIGSPRAISTFLQRIGRSGHSLGAVPRGRLFPLTRDELLECMALQRAVRQGRLDAIQIPLGSLDILAQQIIATVASGEGGEDELFELCRSAWPYRQLSRGDFDAVVRIVSEGIAPGVRHGRYLHRDRIHGRLRAQRNARLTALTSGGAIPETAQFRVVTAEDETYIGQLDEDFAIESMAGDVFLLGNNSWQIVRVRDGQVFVRDAGGAPPTIPFWFGEAPGRTAELSEEVSRLRSDMADRIPTHVPESEPVAPEHIGWLAGECNASWHASRQAFCYIAAQKLAIGLVPSARRVVFERFFDESGGMQLVIHAPFGSRINRAWGLALRKRFCRSFDFELQAAATDDGILLSIGPQHSFPIESMFQMVNPHNARGLLEQAVVVVPMFQVRWRWNVTRALAVRRQQGGKRVPFYLQRYRADDLLAAVFPQTVGCLENHPGDIAIPPHPLVQQTMVDCLHEAMDLDGWLRLLDQIASGEVTLVARETREPSPFSHQLLNANPYAFLDGAALEERRTRAVITRKGLPLDQLKDLAELNPAAIDQVASEAAPTIRDAEELHDVLLELIAVPEPQALAWQPWMDELLRDGRAVRARVCRPTSQQTGTDQPRPGEGETKSSIGEDRSVYLATERWPFVQAVYPEAGATIPVELPSDLDVTVPSATALVELVRGWMAHMGPTTVTELAERLDIRAERIAAALEALEGDGTVMRGHYRPGRVEGGVWEMEWCDRRLLARIHRLTLDGLRRQVQPVSREVFVRHALHHQHLCGDSRWSGPAALREIVAMLQGFELPAGAWESHCLRARMDDYDPAWLDELFMTGEVMWGRLSPPQREKSRRRLAIRLNRSIPISLLLRDDLDWLVSANRQFDAARLRSGARDVLDVLRASGALFFQQLRTRTALLPAQLEDALRELSAAGLVTCDAFAAVRLLVAPGVRRRSRHRGSRRMDTIPGRWSCFPAIDSFPTRDTVAARWCRQLLRRWGVVFRELLGRESAAPPWHELVRAFRTLERRGEVRGGRFVEGVAGEQFATPEAITSLRRLRDLADREPWLAISAADPLNTVGILDPSQDRIPATTRNSLIFQHGQCLAWQAAGTIAFAQDVPKVVASEMARALALGRRVPATEIPLMDAHLR